MAYCCRCGVFTALDDAKMCRACRDGWQPAGDRPGDLGCHAQQPQPLGGTFPVMTMIRWLLFGGNPPAWLARQPFWLLVLFIAAELVLLFAGLVLLFAGLALLSR